MKLDTPVKMDHVRFVCIGCTHGSRLDPATIPPGDILLIAGDFTSCGLPKEVQAFNKNLGEFGVTSSEISGGWKCFTRLIKRKILG